MANLHKSNFIIQILHYKHGVLSKVIFFISTMSFVVDGETLEKLNIINKILQQRLDKIAHLILQYKYPLWVY